MTSIINHTIRANVSEGLARKEVAITVIRYAGRVEYSVVTAEPGYQPHTHDEATVMEVDFTSRLDDSLRWIGRLSARARNALVRQAQAA